MTQLDREPRSGDAFGEALLDALAGGAGTHILERDDGMVDAMDASIYLDESLGGFEPVGAVLDTVSGRVLDVGAGAGRHSLALQDRGHDTVALDVSPGAIQVCRERGVLNTFCGSIDDLAAASPEPFDTVLLLGHNLGLLESENRAGVVFGVMNRLLAPGGIVIGSGMDPYQTDDPIHLAYHERNRQRGRYPGQVLLRVRIRDLAGGWFDYLYVSPDELRELASRHGWTVEQVDTFEPSYLAVLRPV